MVQQLQFSGHKGPVTCLAHSKSFNQTSKKKSSKVNAVAPCCLLSGSEDGTTRLWDFRSSNRASLCIVSPNKEEVTAVGFHPILDHEHTGGGRYSYPFTVFSSVGSTVYGYDLRQTTSPIIISHHHELTSIAEGEEINQITFTTNSNKVHIATADDDGFARVSDEVPNRVVENKKISGRCKKLQHDVSGSALVTASAFRPRGKNLELASGGTDSTICLWDVNRPRRPSSSFFIRREEDEGANQVCNPPIVHSLSWSPSGRLLAAGLGDGSAIVLTVEKRDLVEGCRLRGGHDAAVASVLFPQFGTESSHIVADDRLLVSGGNDGSIFFWDLGKKMAMNAVDPSTMFKDCRTEEDSTNIDKAMKDLSISNDPKILFGLQHGKKPNWIESSNNSDPVLPNAIFIADTSNDITAYLLPRQ